MKEVLLLLSHFSRGRLCATPQTAAHQASRPWDSPGKNTGVGCHFLLQCVKVKSESEVTQSYSTLSDPMDCSLPGSSVHGIFPGKSTGVGCHCLLRRRYSIIWLRWGGGVSSNHKFPFPTPRAVLIPSSRWQPSHQFLRVSPSADDGNALLALN